MADQAQLPDSRQPDLEESTNVTATHARVALDGVAAAREKRLRENGLEPISLTVLIACAVVLLIGGAVLGRGGSSLLSYSETVRPGYQREPSPGEDLMAAPPIAALEAYIRKGNKLYSVKCAGCHGVDGRGSGGIPPLAGSEWVMDHSEQAAMAILNGVMGEITVAGTTYSGAMPAQGAGMSEDDLASVLTYIRNSFGNASGDIITAEMAKNAMAISAGRAKAGQPVTAAELTAEHAKNLEGVPMDPAAMVDPITLQPAAK